MAVVAVAFALGPAIDAARGRGTDRDLYRRLPETATGAEATEAARSCRPNLVLLDIQLPDLDGFEVARRLAARLTARSSC